MPPRRRAAVLVVAPVLLGSTLAYGQGFGGRFRLEQNDPPSTELIVARWRFGTNGAIGHRGWAHNYPSSDRNLNTFIEQATGIDVEVLSYRIVDLGSEEVFQYPFAYVSEPGEMELTEQEVVHLREFIDRGGFILIDDFDGPWQLEQLLSQVRRAFPDRPFLPVVTDHAVFDAHFPLPDLEGMSPYVPGGSIVYYGLANDRGDLALAAGHNNDLANFWDWYDQARMPLKPAADAFRLGINFVIWGMTH